MEDQATMADQGTSGTSTPPERKQQDQKSSIAASAGSSEDKKATKNRKAQQRYRLRQKEKKENIQQQLQLLSRRLTSMELERQSLSERHRILQRLAQFADQRAESPKSVSISSSSNLD